MFERFEIRSNRTSNRVEPRTVRYGFGPNRNTTWDLLAAMMGLDGNATPLCKGKSQFTASVVFKSHLTLQLMIIHYLHMRLLWACLISDSAWSSNRYYQPTLSITYFVTKSDTKRLTTFTSSNRRIQIASNSVRT